MELTVEENTRTLAKEGTEIGILYQIIDLGTQDSQYGAKRKLRFTWELPNQLMDDGKPLVISKTYNRSGSIKANLIKDVHSGYGIKPEVGKSFSLDELLGKPCLLTITHNLGGDGNIYANITGVAQMMAGVDAPSQSNPSLMLDLDKFYKGAFDELPEFLRKIIAESPEYKDIQNGTAGADASFIASAQQAAAANPVLNDEIPL